ncbi:radical SAM protein [Kiloniella spongiae]|uniref:Radical SAM protein n=1 Tax=Kiloniella spongiae TaxID=1489064 RepID=A0A0H2MP29_9PROT|nr:radical SAM protein [Kiloniella spongiae]KLN62522.1 radical SAM protein [Kiloniella spongiae]
MPLYRPPSEGNNLIIQATLGCSANYCTFCSMYKTKTYRARPLDQVFADIDQAAQEWPTASRVFLADGDALTLSMDNLRAILNKLHETFPELTRVSAYATPKNLIDKSVDELRELKAMKLSLVYMGIESGSTQVLKRVIKGASHKTHGMALDNATAAGLKVSATVILGLAGQAGWKDHIASTAQLINEHPPTYLSTLQLTLDEGAIDEFMAEQEAGFEFQDDDAILQEQEQLLKLLDPPKPVIFRSNHASNCLPLAGNLPKDRNKLLDIITAAKEQTHLRRSPFMRGL